MIEQRAIIVIFKLYFLIQNNFLNNNIMKLIVILLCLIIFIIGMSNIYFYYFLPRPIGLLGKRGINGDQGEPGEQGDIGDTGIPGYRGPMGIKGSDIGLRGKTGNQGIRGLNGDAGEKGVKGLKGEKGEKGPPGIKGEKGFPGKKGLEGPIGFPREISSFDPSTNTITNTAPMTLSADRTKCVQVKAFGNEMKCPDNMAVFDIRARKVSFKTADSEIDKIICCKIMMENQHSQSYFNKLNVLTNLQIELSTMIADIKSFANGYIPTNKYHPYLRNYSESERNKILDNITKILTLLQGVQSMKSIREMPLKNLQILLGDNDLASRIKEYSDEEIKNIIENHESITSYEFYILNLMNGLITMKQRKQETPVNTTDNERLLKEVFDFPKNNITELENKVNISKFK